MSVEAPKVGDILVVEMSDDEEEEYPITDVGDASDDGESWSVKAGGDWFEAVWDEENSRWFSPMESGEEE